MDTLKRDLAAFAITWMFWSVAVAMVFLFLSQETINQWTFATRAMFVILGPGCGVLVGAAGAAMVADYDKHDD